MRGFKLVDIFLTNDDGIESLGFLALKQELEYLGELTCVGPSNEKSWIGKAITRFDKVRVNKIKLKDGSDVFSVEGTPVDATLIGLFEILDNLPKLLVSGINTGANAGNAFILSSGTVGTAIEAAMIGLPAIAVSLVRPYRDFPYSLEDFQFAAQITRQIAERILRYGLPATIDLININVPLGATAETEVVITKIAKLHYGLIFEGSNKKDEFKFISKIDAAKGAKYDLDPGSDAYTVFIEKKISISPINIDLTGNLSDFRSWMQLAL